MELNQPSLFTPPSLLDILAGLVNKNKTQTLYKYLQFISFVSHNREHVQCNAVF